MAKKVKSAKHRHFAYFYLIRHVVYVAKVIGVLPATTGKWDISSENPRVSFKYQRFGLIFTLKQLIFIACMAAVTLKYFVSFSSSFTPSFKKTNFKCNPLLLQVICIMGYAVLRSLVLNLYSFIYRTKKTLVCLNLATKLLSKVEGDTHKSAFCMVLFVYILLFTGSFAIFARCFGTVTFLEATPFVSNNLQEIAIICLLVTMFTIIAFSLEDINKALQALDDRCVDVLPRLERLMDRHWETCDLLDNLSQCFGLDVVLQFWYNLNKIVLLTYYSYFMLVTKFRVYTDHFSTLIDVPYRFFVVWYLGSKCDWINYQTEESRRLLAELLIHHNDKLDETCKAMINVFLLRLRSRSAQFSACGLFVLDRAKFYGMLQMAVTYIVVLVQFHSFM